MTNRWKQRPPGSNWGEFGPDDQRGRMNDVTREKVLQGIAEVKEGRSFCLSLPLDYPGGNVLNARRFPPRQFATLRGGKQNFCYPVSQENAVYTDVVCDDLVLLTLQYSTQWDSLAHIGSQFDADGDGVPAPLDCDDHDPKISPAAKEIASSGAGAAPVSPTSSCHSAAPTRAGSAATANAWAQRTGLAGSSVER